MKHYFLVAKDVGDLTRILCAALEDQQAKSIPGLTGVISRFTHRTRKIAGSVEFVEDAAASRSPTPMSSSAIRSASSGSFTSPTSTGWNSIRMR